MSYVTTVKAVTLCDVEHAIVKSAQSRVRAVIIDCAARPTGPELGLTLTLTLTLTRSHHAILYDCADFMIARNRDIDMHE